MTDLKLDRDLKSAELQENGCSLPTDVLPDDVPDGSQKEKEDAMSQFSVIVDNFRKKVLDGTIKPPSTFSGFNTQRNKLHLF